MTAKPIPQPVCHGNGDNYVYVVSGPTGHLYIAVRETQITAAEMQSDNPWGMPGFERQDCWDRIVVAPEDAIDLAREVINCAQWILDREGGDRRRRNLLGIDE
jgi:hypothetical protein